MGRIAIINLTFFGTWISPRVWQRAVTAWAFVGRSIGTDPPRTSGYFSIRLVCMNGGRCARSAEEATPDHPCHAQPSTAIASPPMRARRRRATKDRGEYEGPDRRLYDHQPDQGRPKAASPKLPSAAPAASSTTASMPRRAPGRPAFSLRSRTCFSIRVALAGKIAGKARKRPPITGPKRAAMSPANTVANWPAEHRSDEILVPTRLTKGGRLELDDHES